VRLPELPKIAVEQEQDLSPAGEDGFLVLRRQRLRLRYGDGAASAGFLFDHVERKALDSVVVAAHFLRDGQRWVYLRTSVRPAARLRPLRARPLPEKDSLGVLWELPAGLVEPDECHPGGLARSAAREVHEELGFKLDPGAFLPLGKSAFPCPGIIGERHHFFQVEVDPDARMAPAEDGSELEKHAIVVALPLGEALAAVRAGTLEDMKSEVGLRRLAEIEHGGG
jgi:ADP-ribose pyrophosphatase